MRKVYRAAITVNEADQLIKQYGSGAKQQVMLVKDNTDSIITRLLNQMSQDFQFTVKAESYFRVEKLPIGHGWHQDTGDHGHMKWCELGCSILLTDNFTGGKTWYADDAEYRNPTPSDRLLCDLVAHTSDEWHMVEPHQGNRTVLLMFI